MKRLLCILSTSTALIFATVATSSAAIAQEGAQDGVKVDKMSSLRTMVPEQQLEAQAQEQYASIKAQAQQQGVLAAPTHPQMERLRAIAKKLIPHTQRWNQRAAQWQWEVNLITAKQINAFCMPGGKIAFFTGILDTLKLTDDEIAAVMGHEMAHALREHARERVAKSVLTNAGAKIAGFGLSALFGISPQLTDAAAGGVANLTMLKFSRDDENEADLVGLDLAARAGYDPRAGIALWQKMEIVNKGAPPQWLSTHPAGKNRIEEMRKRLPEVMPLFAQNKGVMVGALPPYQSNVKQVAPVQ